MGLTKTVFLVGTGVALAYFLDPVSGKERRRKLQEYWDDRVNGMGAKIEVDEPSPSVVVDKQPANRTTKPATT